MLKMKPSKVIFTTTAVLTSLAIKKNIYKYNSKPQKEPLPYFYPGLIYKNSKQNQYKIWNKNSESIFKLKIE